MPLLFALAFIGIWLVVTTALGVLSGWFRLAREFPDRRETALGTVRFVSGSVGIVSMRNMLRLQTCPSGLRVGMFRLFGLLCSDFLVPWSDIRVNRTDSFFLGKVAEFEFGRGSGTLRMPAYLADRLARSAPGLWPEFGTFPPETKAQALAHVLKVWAAGTCLAALFFGGMPRMVSDHGPYPPLALVILFPAIVFGVGALFSFFARIRP